MALKDFQKEGKRLKTNLTCIFNWIKENLDEENYI